MQRILQKIMKKNNAWNIRRLVDDSFVPSSKRPSVLYCKLTQTLLFFFHDFLQNSLQKAFQFIFLFFYEIKKIKIKRFECPKSTKSIKKIILGTSDSWLTIRLSHSSKLPSIIYCRLTDFYLINMNFSEIYLYKRYNSHKDI